MRSSEATIAQLLSAGLATARTDGAGLTPAPFSDARHCRALIDGYDWRVIDEKTDALGWLMGWYAAHCDADWEHSYGVKIDTIDNPGWILTIDLTDTDLENRPFDTVAFNMDASDGDPTQSWYHCRIENRQFEAAGGASDLSTMIEIFRAWAERT